MYLPLSHIKGIFSDSITSYDKVLSPVYSSCTALAYPQVNIHYCLQFVCISGEALREVS